MFGSLINLSGMMLLQTDDTHPLLSQGGNRTRGGGGPGQGRKRDDVILHGRAPDRSFIIKRCTPERSVDDQIDLIALDQIDDVRSSFVDLVDTIAGNPGFDQKAGRPARGDNPEAEFVQTFCDPYRVLLIIIVDA